MTSLSGRLSVPSPLPVLLSKLRFFVFGNGSKGTALPGTGASVLTVSADGSGGPAAASKPGPRPDRSEGMAMAGFSRESLVAEAGVDPWQLREQFAAGDPEEIYAMARAFNQAAAEQGDAVALTTRGLETAGDGYQVNNATPIDVAGQVAQARQELGNSGEKLGRVAKILSDIASDLSVRSTAADSQIVSLESDVNAVIREWNDYARQNLHEPDFPNKVNAQRRPFELRAVQKVRDHGNPIKQSVSDYEAALMGHLKTMADLGYVPPDDLDEGPGDVNLTPAQARADAGHVIDALGRQPGRDGLLGITEGSRTVALLNAKVAAGHPLTPSERAYLDAWYDAVGADNLAKLPGYVRQAAPSMADHRRGPDGYPMMTADDVYRQVLSPVADGIMNLSNPAKGGHGSLADMPQAIRDLVNQRVGHVDAATGMRWPNARILDPGDASRHWAQHVLDAGIDGLGRYAGFADLLETSTVTGGDSFTKDLAASAVRVKQDLNALQADARWSLQMHYSGATPDLLNRLNHLVSDQAPSDMLGVVARNHSASSDVLLDQRLRQEVMGLNWRDEGGAAALMHSGTERNPALGGGTAKQAQAALAVVQEIAGDRDGYLARMGEHMEDSVKDIGVQYIDSFARDPAGSSQYRADLTDPLGRNVGPSFELTSSDRDRFLQFVSGTGDDDATDFQAKATAYSEVMLADAFRHGNPPEVQEALHEAGALDGAITQANFDYTFDRTDAADKQAAAAARADSLHNTALKTGISFGTVVVGTGVSVASGGTLSPVVAITSAAIISGTNLAVQDDPAPAAALPTTRDQLLHADHEQYAVRRDYLVLQAAVDGGVVDPATLPASLVRADGTGHYALVPPDDLDGSQAKQDLRVASDGAVNGYEATHRTPTDSGDVDKLEYDNARQNVADGTWDHGNPRTSPWSGHRAQDLGYGDNRRPGGIYPGYPDDPRRLDDPHYDPTHPNG
jgi:hypothetical protein